jgi:hypothetical protein
VMAIGLFLILRMGKEDTEKDETEVSEER